MQNEIWQEAKRQADICNACRYCEGYCDVFPALQTAPQLDAAKLTELANICHNCRGCYYACQYTAPHEFDLNFPKALAELRNQSWQEFSWPQPLAKKVQQGGFGVVVLLVALFFVLFAILQMPAANGGNFYDHIPHGLMIAIFIPAFSLPLIALFIGLRSYWKFLGGGGISLPKFTKGLTRAATLKNLSGGEAHGCNFEEGDRFSNARKWAHHLLAYGFLLCFLATSLGTIWHYVFHNPAPYPLLSAPKLSGVLGGIMMVVGGLWMMGLKHRADQHLSDESTKRSEFAFTALLTFIAATGLALYGFSETRFLGFWLSIHLASVLTLFILTPYSKMAHGFYRLLAMMRNQ